MSKYLPIEPHGPVDFAVPRIMPSTSYSAAPMEPEDEEVLKIIRSLGNMSAPTDTAADSYTPLASFGPRCTRCGNPCGNDVYYHGPLPFHKKHFVCKRCGGPLHVPITINNDVYCQNCARMVKPKAPICHQCNGQLTDKPVIVAGKCFCEEHFTCAKCGQVLQQNNFVQRSGKFYCPNHAPESPKSVCCVCKLQVEGQNIVRNGLVFHPECFVCTGCRQNLAHVPYSFIRNKPYCLSCADKAQNMIKNKRLSSFMV
ncbi:LIM domain containing protein [Trichomonas vaginalis G3]|uniref:LIM domain containing protein n=1 Tax=Trichomonas vaginalis (strain ATCC PRA-98 / G3) TaxID=412133 RepID=A2DWQ7_TRIV3|nr:uncharacterized protein TVAGG3_0839960 [Trichomonas vaginalis G3]EAY15089.1 LIM domain containing protein [Trichomonas vaginalis G3]KAI5499229.1 actinin binding [Trichomonas vaginalis G3]|eukprot:XP_001327312.1 hypothetical protein [Trichomonas vaginalis G3]